MVAVFFGSYFALSKIDWVTIFQVETLSKATEEKVGDMFWEFYEKSEKELKNLRIVGPVDSILTRITDANNIDRKSIKLHVISNSEVNAFALPNNHLVIYTGLINDARSVEELAGVMGHELGHLQKRHVMKKLIKEAGIGAIISMTTKGGGEVIRESASTLTSRAYDRRLEKEADIASVEYLANANIDPRPFADFLARLADLETDLVDLSWFSTHPGSADRSDYILDYCKDMEVDAEPVIAVETWLRLKEAVKE
jgi:beta-barrel assembly-enhancing protease